MAVNSGLTLTSGDNFLKTYYSKKNMLDALMYQEGTFLKDVNKQRAMRVTGKEVYIPFRLGRNSNFSRDFEDAQSQAKESTGLRSRWLVKVVKDYAVVRVDNLAISASADNQGAFVSLLKDETNDALQGLKNRRAKFLYGGGNSYLARVGSIAGKVVTLRDKSDIRCFEPNQSIEIWSTASGAGSQRGTGTTVDKRSKDEDGKITLEDTLAGVVAGDYIFQKGDRGETADVGLAGWLPKDEITSAQTFMGISDRTRDVDRLQGHRIDMTSSDNYDEIIRRVSTRAFNATGVGGQTLYMNPLRKDHIVTELGDKIRYNREGTKGTSQGVLGFSDIGIHTAGGFCQIKADPWCDRDLIYGLDMQSVCLYYIAPKEGGYVHFVKAGSGGILDKAHDADGVEARIASYGALAVPYPGRCFVIDASAKTL